MQFEKLGCLKCGSPIERQPGPGRPPIYCGPPCRSAAAYEIRRVQRRLEALEMRLSSLRRSELPYWDGAWHRKRREKERDEALEALQAEIDTAEERLRLLLSEPRGKALEPAP